MSYLTDEQQHRLRQFKDCFCIYPAIDHILNDLDVFFESSEIGGEPLSMLLAGDTGTGKSSLIRYFVESKFNSEAEQSSILLTRVPSKASAEETTKQMLIDLNVFGSSVSARNVSDQSLTNRLIAAVKDLEIRLIIINEFQELVEFKKPKERQVISNRLKLISESTGVPMILVGMPWIDEILQDPQWASRLATRPHQIEYFSLIQRMSDYRSFMRELEGHIPVDSEKELSGFEMSLRIFAATRGEHRQIKALLTEASRLGMLCQLPVSGELYGLAFKNLYPQSAENPFGVNLEKLKFREVEMNSIYIRGDSTKPAQIEPPRLSDFYSVQELLNKR